VRVTVIVTRDTEQVCRYSWYAFAN
jgi:hypothetical protein